jgi:hypothetical protein
MEPPDAGRQPGDNAGGEHQTCSRLDVRHHTVTPSRMSRVQTRRVSKVADGGRAAGQILCFL